MVSYDELLDLLKEAKSLHALTGDPMLLEAIPILAGMLAKAPVTPGPQQKNALTYVRATVRQRDALFGPYSPRDLDGLHDPFPGDAPPPYPL